MVVCLYYQMPGVFPDIICQIILTGIYTTGYSWTGMSGATREGYFLIPNRIIIICLIPFNFTKNNTHVISEMILGIFTLFTSANILCDPSGTSEGL